MLRQLALFASAATAVYYVAPKAFIKLCELTGALPKEEETKPDKEEKE